MLFILVVLLEKLVKEIKIYICFIYWYIFGQVIGLLEKLVQEIQIYIYFIYQYIFGQLVCWILLYILNCIL